jgi:hypothetical protein
VHGLDHREFESVEICRLPFKVPEIKALTIIYFYQCLITVWWLILKTEGFPLWNFLISCSSDRDVLFVAINNRYTGYSNPWFFLTVHGPKLILGKIMQNYPCWQYLLGKNGIGNFFQKLKNFFQHGKKSLLPFSQVNELRCQLTRCVHFLHIWRADNGGRIMLFMHICILRSACSLGSSDFSSWQCFM